MINTHETPEKGITRERQNSRFPAFLTISAMWWFHFRSRETFTPRILACETISICLSLIAIGSSSRDSFVLNFSARRWGFLTNPHLHTLRLIQLELAEWDEAIQVTQVIQYITNVTGYSVQKITQHISIPYRSNCIIKGSWKVCCANPQGGRFSAQLLLYSAQIVWLWTQQSPIFRTRPYQNPLLCIWYALKIFHCHIHC